jgi:hypothetical protein
MHAPYDKPRKGGYRTELKSSAGFLILPAIIAFMLIAFTTFHPKALLWISEAVEAEFVGGNNTSNTPTQIAQPDLAAPVQTVRVY